MDPITYGGPAGQISAELPADDAIVTAQAPSQASDGRSVPAVAPLFRGGRRTGVSAVASGGFDLQSRAGALQAVIPSEVEAQLNPGEVARAVFDRESAMGPRSTGRR